MVTPVPIPSIRSLSCTILRGKYGDCAWPPAIYNSAYAYWREMWAGFFARAGSPPDALKADNFLRADYIIVLHDGPVIAGMVLATVFHGQASVTFDHPSIAPFPLEIREKLAAWEGGRALTGEYLSVNPAFKKSVLGVSLAEILCGLLHKILHARNIDMLLASTVRAAHVADIGFLFGYREVGSFTKLGVDCVLMFNTTREIRRHPNGEMLAAVDHFWANKTDYTEQLHEENSAVRAA